MKTLKKFNIHNDYITYRDSADYIKPNVSACKDNNDVHYNYIQNYMKLTALTDGDITITIPSSVGETSATSISYSKDGSNWTETLVKMNVQQTITIPVVTEDKVYLKGVAKQWTSDHGLTNTNINSTANINVSGNVMSLFYGDDFVNQTSFPDASRDYNLYRLFYNNTHLIDASELILPATTMVFYCYSCMFESCTSLTSVPSVLPATTLASSCYNSMFKGCTSLTSAPELPATKLASTCYWNMFYGCTALTTAPELPATTLAEYCYSSMFYGCTSLTTAPELPATTMVTQCYRSMFQNCTSLTSAPSVLPATTMVTQCYRSMFQNCTSLTSAPSVLPATTLANYCYISMFKGCTHLTKAPKLPTTTLVDNCYYTMFQNCTSLNNITMLAENIATNCFTNWVSGVASTGTFTKAVNTTLPTGNSGIPTGWVIKSYHPYIIEEVNIINTPDNGNYYVEDEEISFEIKLSNNTENRINNVTVTNLKTDNIVEQFNSISSGQTKIIYDHYIVTSEDIVNNVLTIIWQSSGNYGIYTYHLNIRNIGS